MNLTPRQIDALQEIINMGVGRAAAMLNDLLHSHVVLQVPSIEVLCAASLESKLRELAAEIVSAVRLTFKGSLSGVASLIFPKESAGTLVSILAEAGVEAEEMDEIRIGTLNEVGNIVLNGVMGVIGNELGQRILYTVPVYIEDPLEILAANQGIGESDTVILGRTRFSVQQHCIEGDILLIFSVQSFEALIAAIEQQLGALP